MSMTPTSNANIFRMAVLALTIHLEIDQPTKLVKRSGQYRAAICSILSPKQNQQFFSCLTSSPAQAKLQCANIHRFSDGRKSSTDEKWSSESCRKISVWEPDVNMLFKIMQRIDRQGSYVSDRSVALVYSLQVVYFGKMPLPIHQKTHTPDKVQRGLQTGV